MSNHSPQAAWEVPEEPPGQTRRGRKSHERCRWLLHVAQRARKATVGQRATGLGGGKVPKGVGQDSCHVRMGFLAASGEAPKPSSSSSPEPVTRPAAAPAPLNSAAVSKSLGMALVWKLWLQMGEVSGRGAARCLGCCLSVSPFVSAPGCMVSRPAAQRCPD